MWSLLLLLLAACYVWFRRKSRPLVFVDTSGSVADRVASGKAFKLSRFVEEQNRSESPSPFNAQAKDAS